MSRPLRDQSSTFAPRAPTGHVVSSSGRPELVSGYRVLRRTGDRHGGHVRSAVFERAASGDGLDTASRTAVSIVSFDAAVAEERSMRLIDRLERLAAPGVPRVLDVVVEGADGPAVVLEFCGDSIASILAGGAEITAGEIVTLVAPILATLVSLHDSGFAHGDVSVASIALGAGGRPLLLGCERAVELSTQQASAREAATNDLHRLADALAELGHGVRDPHARDRVIASADALRSGAVAPFSPAFRAAAEVRLFEIAEPSPLAFSVTTESELLGAGRASPVVRSAGALRPRAPARRWGLVDAVGGLLARVRGRLGSSAQREGGHQNGRGRRQDPVDRAGRTEHVDHSGRGGHTEHEDSLDSRGRRGPQPERGRSRRRGPLIVGATIVAVTIALLVLVPTGAPARSTGSVEEQRTTRAKPETPGRAAAHAAPTTSTPAPDDAVVATTSALDRIAGCVAAPGDPCWSSVIEADTALLATLSASDDPLSELPAALALPVDAVEITPREDYGDLHVVLVTPSDETRPASVLMIRTEAGWRVRNAFDA